MELRRVSYNTFDCFYGKGWDNHSRVRKSKAGTYVMSGNRLPKPELRALDNVLSPTLPITPGMSLEQTEFNLSFTRNPL